MGSSLLRVSKDTNHKFLLLSRTEEGGRFLKGDIGDDGRWVEEFKKFKPEAVIHLAWENVANYNTTTLDVALKNFHNSLKLYRLSSEIGCKKFIALGSIAEHLGNMNLFLASKVSLRAFGEAISKDSPTQFLWVRPFYIYGPGQRPQALLPSIIVTLINGGTPDIKNPLLEQDFIYVDDVAHSLLIIAEKSDSKFEVYEVGQGKVFSIGGLTNIAYQKLGLKERYNDSKLIPRGEAKPLQANSSLIQSLGWRPETDYEKGIEEMINFYKSQNLL